MSLIRTDVNAFDSVDDVRTAFVLAHGTNAIPDDFWPWLSLNPTVWSTFLTMAHRALKARPRYSARTIIEVMRWNTDILEAGGLFKLNNNHVPPMARLFNFLAGVEFFNTRKEPHHDG